MAYLHGKDTRLLVHGKDVSIDSHLLTLQDGYRLKELIMGAQPHVGYNRPGERETKLAQQGFLNPDATHDHIKDMPKYSIVSIVMDTNVSPQMFSFGAALIKYDVLAKMSGVIPFQARYIGQWYEGGWGTPLALDTDISGTSQGVIMDAGTPLGTEGAGFLHILGATDGAFSLRVLGSETGAFMGEESLLLAFTLDGSATGSERAAIKGAVPRYLRWDATETQSGSQVMTVAINIVRIS